MISGKTKTLLLVEDEILIAMSEQKDLENYGYKVILAHSGEEAIELCHSTDNIDLIIMDIDLGDGIDGTETSEKILIKQEIPILFMSSHMEPEIVEKTEEITSYGYVLKNSSITVLDASIKMAFKLFDAKIKEHAKEEALLESESKLRQEHDFSELINNTMSAILLLLDKEGKILKINPYMEKLSGYKLNEVKGKDWFTTFLPECDYDKTRELFKKAIGKEITKGNINPILTKDKKEILIEWYDDTIIDKDGNIIGLLCFGIDVTKRKQVEENLLFQSTLLSCINDRITATDLEGRITYVNEAECRTFGKTADELIGQNVNKYGDDKNQGATQKEIIATTLSKGEWHGEVVNFTEDGEKIIFDSRIQLLHDNDDKPVGMLGISTDITIQKKAEEALKESEMELDTLLNATTDKVFLVKSDGTLLAVNSAFSKSLGVEKEKLINYSMYEFGSKEDVEKRKSQLQKAIESKKSFQWKDERAGKYFDNSVFPIFNDKGDVKQIALFARDITEKVKAEEILHKYEYILSSVRDHMSFINQDYIYSAVNEAYLQAHQKEPSQIIGHTVAEILGVDIFEQFVKDKLNCCLAGEEIHYQGWFDFLEQGQRYMDVTYYPYTGPDGIITGVVVSSHDITDRKKAEQDLKKSEENYRSLFNKSPISLWKQDISKVKKLLEGLKSNGITISREYFDKNPDLFTKCLETVKILNVNKAALNLFKYKNEDKIVENINNMCNDKSLETIKDELVAMANNEKSFIQETELLDSNGKIIQVIVQFEVINNYKNIILSILDITKQKESRKRLEQEILDRKKGQEKIQTLLAEKETILKEVHHRIKNNMMTLKTLLKLQSRNLEIPELNTVFQDAISRISSMGILYDKLYQNKDYQEVSTQQYLSALVDEIYKMFSNLLPVSIEKQIEDFKLGSKTILPFGIILNELITNSMKYAFPENNNNLIQISVTKSKTNVILIYKDNGIGLSEIDTKSNKGFGLNLIELLVKQLNGNLLIENKNGAKFTIEFEE